MGFYAIMGLQIAVPGEWLVFARPSTSLCNSWWSPQQLKNDKQSGSSSFLF